MKKKFKSEKLEAHKTEVKVALKVGSLLVSSRLKAEREEVQQPIFAFEGQNE